MEPIKGTRKPNLARRTAPILHVRQCNYPGCDTLLSKYNRSKRCYVHGERKFRVRGKVPKPV